MFYPLIKVLIGCFVAYVVTLIFVSKGLMAPVAILVVLFACIIQRSQLIWSIYVFFLFMFFVGFFDLINVPFPQVLNQVDEGYTFFIILYMLFHPKRVAAIKNDRFFLVAMCLFICVVVVSSFINSVNFFNSVRFIIYNIEPLVFTVLLITLGLQEKEYHQLFSFIVSLSVVQALLGILQSASFFVGKGILINPKTAWWQDVAMGTMGAYGMYGAHLLGHLMIFMMIIALNIFFIKGNLRWGLGFLLFFIAFVLTYTETAYIFLPVMFLPLFFFKSISIGKKMFLSFVCFGAVAMFLVFSAYTGYRYLEVLSMQKLEGTGKYQSFVITQEILLADSLRFLFGHGGGAFASDSLDRMDSKLYRKYFGMPKKIESTKDGYASTFVTLLVETGILGFIIYFMPVCIIFVKALKETRLSVDRVRTALNLSLILLTVYMIFLTLMFNVFERNIFPHVYFFMAVYVFYLNRKHSNIKSSECEGSQ